MSLPDPPEPGTPDYPVQASRWVIHHGGLPQLMLELPALEAYPRGAARASWMVCFAVAAAQETGTAPAEFEVGEIISGRALTDVLPGEVGLLLRGVRVHLAEMEGTAALRRRMELLAQVGPALPLEWPR